MSGRDMTAIARQTRFVAGLPVAGGEVGGDPGPHTALGVFLGIKAAVRRALGKDSLAGLHIVMQGAGSVASGVARRAAEEGARLTIADVAADRAKAVAAQTAVTRAAKDGNRRAYACPFVCIIHDRLFSCFCLRDRAE